MEYFCTYFDHNYLIRGVEMIASLRRVCPAAQVHVLALSDLCASILEELELDGVSVVGLAQIEARFPELPACRSSRSAVEYIFTLTPFLPRWCLDQDPTLRRITYLDADLMFYASPAPLFDSLGDHALAIMPHRFSPDRIEDIKYGRFNVGWNTYVRSPEGIRCLEDYSRQVVEWCYDRVEDGKFADQKYLDAWPDRYDGTLIIQHKGANAAPWNIDNYTLSQSDGRLYVDDEPLIFYHFHGVQRQPDGNFTVHLPRRHGVGESVLRRLLYRPYLARLIAGQVALERCFAALNPARNAALRSSYGTATPEPRPERRIMDGEWRDDPALAGWQSDFVTRARLRRALIAPPVSPHAERIRRLLATIASPKVLDFGGGLVPLLPESGADWIIAELSTVADHAAGLTEARFVPPGTIESGADLVIAGNVLHYLRDWRAELVRLAHATRGYLLLLDLPVIAGDHDRLVEETPAAYDFRVTMQSWLIGESSLACALAATGLRVVEHLPSRPGPATQDGPATVLVSLLLAA